MSNAPRTLPWHTSGLTDIGRVRRSNQDHFELLDAYGCWIIADGMGGHAGGGIASHVAVEAIATAIKQQQAERRTSGEENRLAQRELEVTRAILTGHAAVREAAAQQASLAGMGTTVVVLRIYLSSLLSSLSTLSSPTSPTSSAFNPSGGDLKPEAVIGHVGDSRAYLLRDGVLKQLTADHSLVEEYRRGGLLSAEEARDHPLRHVLSRAVGPDREVRPDCTTHPLTEGDRVLLCTDGLTKMLTDREITACLLDPGSPGEACERLVRTANDRGGEDNTTVVLVQLGHT